MAVCCGWVLRFASLSVSHVPEHKTKPKQAGHDSPWCLYRLEDNQDTIANVNERREEYVPVRVSEAEIEMR